QVAPAERVRQARGQRSGGRGGRGVPTRAARSEPGRVARVAQRAVTLDALLVAVDAVCREEFVLPARPVVPVHAATGDRQIGPTVGDTEQTQVDMTAE